MVSIVALQASSTSSILVESTKKFAQGSFFRTFQLFIVKRVYNMIDWIREKEKIEERVNNGSTYESIGRMFGCTGANIKKQCKKLGIPIIQRRKINASENFNKGKKHTRKCANCGNDLPQTAKKYCCLECQQEKQYKDFIERWKRGEEDGVSGRYGVSNHIKRYLFEKHHYKCEKCDWGEENPITHNIPLQIHHINGDCTDNREENLQLLCPNCHSLTETFGNLNKNSKRIFRKQKGNM